MPAELPLIELRGITKTYGHGNARPCAASTCASAAANSWP